MDQEKQVVRSTVNNSTRHLLNSILRLDGGRELAKPLEVLKNIEQYKTAGVVNFGIVCSIPVPDRIPGLVAIYGSEKIHATLVVMLTDFCNYYNVIRPMSSDQIVLCAFEMISTSVEDYLSIEDMALFFHGAKQGKYGRVLDHLDQHVIFEMLENYRQLRHTEYHSIKENKHLEYSGMGDRQRSGSKVTAMDEHLSQFTTKLAQKKDEIQELRAENRRLRDQNNF